MQGNFCAFKINFVVKLNYTMFLDIHYKTTARFRDSLYEEKYKRLVDIEFYGLIQYR